jgi:hypothetical protein
MAKKNKNSLALYLGGIILALLAVIIYQNFYQAGGFPTITKEDLSKKIVDIIAKDIGSSDEVSVKEIIKEGSLYKLTLDVMGQEYESYATLDGEYLFPQVVDLTPPEPKAITKQVKPSVDLFVMAYCPFGNQAEDIMAPVVSLLGEKSDIELHYVFYDNYASGYPDYCFDEENKYCSMHGIQEVNQGIRELCVQKYQPEKLWDFVLKMNEETTSENADEKWEAVAQELDLDIDQVKQCQEEEALDILEKEVSLTNKEYLVQNPASHNNKEKAIVTGSPTLVINDIIYDGERSAAAYQEALCSAFKEAPEACNEILENTETTSDATCE